MVKLVHGLHQESPRVVELKVGFHHECLGGDHGCPGVVKLVMELHHRSPTVVKLEVGLHQGCYIREHRSLGDEASDGASPPKIQEGENHEGTSPWESQRVHEASVGASTYGLPHPCEPVSGQLYKWG